MSTKEKKKKRKHFKFPIGKILVWLAVLAMLGMCVMEILSPILYRTTAR